MKYIWQKFLTIRESTRRKWILILTLILCVILAYIMNGYDEIGKVYTHLFYIPVILAGSWYRRKAYLLSLTLGITHIGIEYAAAGSLTYAPVVRASALLAVTIIVVLLSEYNVWLQQKVSEQDIFTRQINESTTDIMGRCDMTGKIWYVNSSVQRTFGYTQQEMMNHDLTEYILGEDREKLHRAMLEAIASETEMRERYRGIQKDGGVVWLELTLNPVISNGVCIGTVFLGYNITERKQSEDRIREKAYTDELTGICNRRYIDEIFEKKIKEANEEPFSILMIDIDYFKKVNDQHGHPTGDKVLKELAGLLQKAIRQYDYLARIGGEEFIIILQRNDEYGSWEVAERIRRQIEGNWFDTVGKVTVSIGISAYTSSDDVETLYKNADTALYLAKDRGRNRVAIFSRYGYHPLDFTTITWDPEWDSEDLILNEQHRNMLSIVNGIAQKQMNRISYTNLNADLFQLKEKLISHFEYEENMLKRVKYPDAERHITMHNIMMRNLERIIIFTSKSDEIDLLVLYQFLLDIILGHVGKEDRLFFHFTEIAYIKHLGS